MKTLRNFFSLLTLILSLFLLLSTIFLSAQPDYNDKIRAEIKDNFPKPRSGKIYVIAHRGAHVGIPENSLPAFQKAIDLGCDFVEIDTRATKDGKIVSVHNATIDQYVSGETGRVKNFTLAELKQFSIGEKTGPEWKVW